MLDLSVGYRWIHLDPQVSNLGVAPQISSPDQHGRRQQVPGGPEPGHPQELIFEIVVEARVVWYDEIG